MENIKFKWHVELLFKGTKNAAYSNWGSECPFVFRLRFELYKRSQVFISQYLNKSSDLLSGGKSV